MNIETTHYNYYNRLKRIRKMRDVVGGNETIKARGEEYLPRLKGHSDQDYETYKRNSYFFGATGRTILAATGMIFRKPYIITSDVDIEIINQLESNFVRDNTGCTLNFTAFSLVLNCLQVGKHGLLINFPDTETENVSSLKEFNDKNFLPYVFQFIAEDIVNWDEEYEGKYNLVVLNYPFYKRVNRFEHELVERKVVLELQEGIYIKEIWIRDQGDWEIISTSIPKINGKPLDYLPFFCIDTDPNPPPFLELAEANLAHYRYNSALQNGLPLVALPTPYIIGTNLDETNLPVENGNHILPLGPQKAFHSVNEKAQVGYFSFDGAGVEKLMELVKEVKEEMAVLGSRQLAGEKKQVETAEVANIHRIGENASLAMFAQMGSSVLTKCMQTMLSFLNIPEEQVTKTEIVLNTDFVPTNISYTLTDLSKLFTDSTITYKTLFENLQQQDIISLGTDFESYEKEIKEQKEERMALATSIFNNKDGKTDEEVAADALNNQQENPTNQQEDPTNTSSESTKKAKTAKKKNQEVKE